jgi:hypothetical protein
MSRPYIGPVLFGWKFAYINWAKNWSTDAEMGISASVASTHLP